MKARIEKDKLIIECDLRTPEPSSTGKNMLVVSESEKDAVKLPSGQLLKIQVNAYYKADQTVRSGN